MQRIILASHGSFATGLKSAIEMIVGVDERIESYDLDHYARPSLILEKVEEKIRQNSEDNFIILTDILGGSIHNELLRLCTLPNVVIASGVNLAMAIEVVIAQDSSLTNIIENAIAESKKNMIAFDSHKLKVLLKEEGEFV